MKTSDRTILRIMFALLLFVPVVAAAQSYSGLPWDGGLCSVVGDISGPTAAGIMLVGIVGAGVMFLFQGSHDFHAWIKIVLGIVFAGAFILGGVTLIQHFYPNAILSCGNVGA